jgi:hypothetical protein
VQVAGAGGCAGREAQCLRRFESIRENGRQHVSTQLDCDETLVDSVEVVILCTKRCLCREAEVASHFLGVYRGVLSETVSEGEFPCSLSVL